MTQEAWGSSPVAPAILIRRGAAGITIRKRTEVGQNTFLALKREREGAVPIWEWFETVWSEGIEGGRVSPADQGYPVIQYPVNRIVNAITARDSLDGPPNVPKSMSL